MHFTRAERKIMRKKRKLMICRVTFLIQADLCPSLPPLGRAQLSSAAGSPKHLRTYCLVWLGFGSGGFHVMKLQWPSPCSKRCASCEGQNQSQLLLQAVNRHTRTK